MPVKLEPLDLSEVSSRVQKFESKYGIASPQLAEAFRDEAGKLHETEDYFEWSHSYSVLRLALRKRT